MEYMQLSMDDYIQSKNEIKQELGGIVKSFVRIGWQLTRIDKSQAFKHDGYNTIAEFAKAEYGMNPSGVSRFIKVYEKYSVPGDTPELQEQYKDFKFNNLVEMLQLPEEDQQIFKPSDKREDIRELKDFNKENENNPMNLLDWKSAQSTEDKLRATIQEFFREKHGVLNTLYASEAYQTGNIKEMAQIINPGDSMSYRKGTVFLMFHQEDITVKIFNGEMKNISWEQFFTYVQEIFAEAAAGAKTYENYFGIPEETLDPTPEETPKPTLKPTSKPASEHSVRPEPEIAPAQTEAEDAGSSGHKNSDAHSGFLYIKCEHCGSERAYCQKAPSEYSICKRCGSRTYFTEPLKQILVSCECGQRSRYLTNMTDDMFDIQCIDCGSPVAVKYNQKTKCYETIR